MSGTRRALLIAASDYADPDLTRLRWPAADVDSLAEVLGDGAIGDFDVQEPLVNEPSHVVKRRIETFLRGATSEDVRLLYFSCHGVLSDDRRLYFAMTDTETESIMSTSVDDYFVHAALQRSRAGAKVLILDCCHSGAFARGLPSKGSNEREIDVERLTGTGLVTLTASKEIEYAYEHGEFTPIDGAIGGSLFTKVMVEGLRTGKADLNDDGVISVDELYEWTAEQMAKETTRQEPGHSSFRRHGRVPIGWTRRSRLPDEVRARLEDTSVHGRMWAIDRLRALAKDADPELSTEIRDALTKAVGAKEALVAASAEAALNGRPPPTTGVATRDAPPAPSMKAASLTRRGDDQRAARRFRVALDRYDEALRVSPGATNARVGRAHALLGLGLVDDALEALDAALDDDPTHVWARVSRADLLVTLDRPAAAQLDVDAALETEPDSTEALTIQGRALAALGHLDEAVEAYENALEHDRDHLEALVGLGEALAESGTGDRALAAIDRAIAIDEASVEARLTKARIHYDAGKLRSGDAEIAEVLSADAGNVGALLTRGLAHLRREGSRTRNPLKDFDLALEVDPDLPGALYGRAVALKHKAPRDALEAIERVDPSIGSRATWRPSLEEVRMLQAELLLDLDEPERALAAAEAGLVESAVDPPGLYFVRARAHVALGLPERALADLNRRDQPDTAPVEELRRVARGSLMSRPREVWPDGIGEDDVAQSLHGDTLLRADLPGPPVDPMIFARKLTPADELLWFTACRYRNESFRRVALLMTSMQLIWAGRSEGSVHWREVRDVRPIPPAGMRLVLRSGRRLEFPGIANDGTAFGGDARSLDANGVRDLAASLTRESAPIHT